MKYLAAAIVFVVTMLVCNSLLFFYKSGALTKMGAIIIAGINGAVGFIFSCLLVDYEDDKEK